MEAFDLKQIAEEVRPWLTPILMLISGVYIRSILTKISKIDKLDLVIAKVNELQEMKKEWISTQIELAKTTVKLENAVQKFDDVVVVQRDLKTAFKQIDQLKDKVFDLGFDSENK